MDDDTDKAADNVLNDTMDDYAVGTVDDAMITLQMILWMDNSTDNAMDASMNDVLKICQFFQRKFLEQGKLKRQ